jgi:carboxymethylenebutenolidase
MKLLLLLLSLVFSSKPISAQEFSLKQLEESPRHQEWLYIQSGERTIVTFVVYPEVFKNAPVVVVIHENRGLTDWVRSFADQLAAEGYLAIAPDLLSDYDAKHSRTRDFENPDDARDAIYRLDPDQVTKDLQVVVKRASQMPSANGKTVVIGFCWGGQQAFRFATISSDISAAIVFYGSPPDAKQLAAIAAPVYGFYGENDQRINATIRRTLMEMKKLGKTYEYEIYKSAGHAYMRIGDDPAGPPEYKKARDNSWARLKRILSQFK